MKKYTFNEEIANSVTHGIGAGLSVIGLFMLISKSAENTFIAKTSLVVYAITMFLMFLSSSLYHGVPGEKLKKKMKTLDHCAIFLLIAGTYTPFTTIVLKGLVGTWLFIIIWAFAIIGIVLNTISVAKYSKLSLICYVVMGWAVLFAVKPLVAALPLMGVVLLTLGGIAYTVGIVFYLLSKKYMHTVWHLFVMAGSILHFFTIYFYIA